MSTRNRPDDLVERFDRENDQVARLGRLWLDATARIERWRAEIGRCY